MPPMLMLIVAVAGAPPPTPTSTPAAQSKSLAEASRSRCATPDPRDIVVCGKPGQPNRVDLDVMEAQHEAESNSRSATSAIPPAQSSCALSKAGCTKDLSSLDLANAAIVIATTIVRAGKGEDWAKAFRTGPDEYQAYQQAKRRREAEAQARAAAEVQQKAEAEERKAHAATPGSD